jgi:hypothetical protein
VPKPNQPGCVVDLMVANGVVRQADGDSGQGGAFRRGWWWTFRRSNSRRGDRAAEPRHIARKYRVVPVFKHDNSLTVAIADPSDLDTLTV